MERSPGINVIQKMIFIFNALESGWIVRKVEGDKYEFKKHKVMEAETLGHIMSEYYGGSGLNMQFVQIAILQFNRSAFVRGNPNFLYAGKKLHLPSVNQIRALITKEKFEKSNASENGKRNEIFFFGS